MPSSLSIDLLVKTFHYCTYAPKRLIPQTIILCQNIEGHADILRIDKTDNNLEVFMFKSFLPSAAAAFALLLMPTAASAHAKHVSSDRQRVVAGMSVSVRVDFGGRRIKKQKTKK